MITTSENLQNACSVLLVEDNPADAKLTKYALANVSNSQYAVQHVTQLSAAVDRIKQGGIDVALVDLSLPDSNGLETFRTLAAAARSVPIVVLTGMDDEHLAVGLLQDGAQDYLLKNDIEPKLLARSIRYAIERNRATTLESLNQKLEVTTASLQQAVADLERANVNLAQFSQFASHDLHEPLRKINYFATRIQANAAAELNAESQRDLGYILDACRRMQVLIHSLLLLCKAGSEVVEFGPIDVNTCVDDALDCLSARIEAKGAKIVRDRLPVIKGDSTLLVQLYQNLIGNALKFNESSEPIIHLTAEPHDERWILGIRDNGIGIDPKFAQNVFAPFQRLNGRTKYEGAGIGLTICKKVVERHGGTIWVESQPGAGAHFKFDLPAVMKSSQLATKSAPFRPAADDAEQESPAKERADSSSTLVPAGSGVD